MTIEMGTFAFSIILGLVHLVMSSHFTSFKYGYKWTASNRDTPMPPLDGIHGRMDRIAGNYLETFPFFAAAIMVDHLTGHHNALTIWGCQL